MKEMCAKDKWPDVSTNSPNLSFKKHMDVIQENVDTFEIGFKRLWLFVHSKLDLAVKLRNANKNTEGLKVNDKDCYIWLRIFKEINHLACLPLPEVVSIKVTTYHRWRQMVKSYTSIVKTFASFFDALQMRTSIFSGPFVAKNSLDYASFLLSEK